MSSRSHGRAGTNDVRRADGVVFSAESSFVEAR